MKIKLIPEKIIENLPSEKELSELSLIESFYVIRKLKALTFSQINGFIKVNKKNNFNQVFSKEYDIWFNSDDFIKL